ncbi:putative integral membrane protein (TIGR02206 family) [Scopulibacillus darangshiensis]|uniref:Putative integral membrane protein (TIGR02206 family) n=1 Tax=Scopulibacillus darangshiensis TaxID=442528 RepID=A0A4R2NXW0_9BACL|nr:TIGR02206 family membrane protein [Scopulibacillus darangshiensis]TCP27073.1 putative integral membrane protein (TIGR02206 family) [Scopulibacillus darangshiensis]
MEKYFAYHYKGEQFHLFSKEHLITLLIIGLLGVMLLIFRVLLRHRGLGECIRYLLAFLLLATEVCLQIWYVSSGAWSVRYALPLQLSDITVLLTIIMLLTRSANLFKFLYFAGLGSAIQAMLTPDLGIYSFPHFRYIEFFVSHGGAFLSILFMAAVERYHVSIRSLWITVLIVDIYGAIVFFVNRMIDANYLYIMKKPKGHSILDFLGPWPWYMLSLEAVMIIIFFILYALLRFSRKLEENIKGAS